MRRIEFTKVSMENTIMPSENDAICSSFIRRLINL